jgi:acetyltransferase
MLARIAAEHPGVRVDGVTVERMVSARHGRELILGITSDEVFGPAITFGAGGVAVEVLRDLSIALPPLNARLIEDLVGSTRVSKMLGAFRHLPAVDRAAVAGALQRVSEIACAVPEVAELDINPLLAEANGVLALDARVVLRARPAGEAPFARLAIHPYPDELEHEERLPGGERVVVRPIRPEDAGIERDFVAGLSDQSRWWRFQSGLRTLTPEMLARFTQIDYDREMALVAIAEEGGVDREVAVCRYVTLPDALACEYAIVVADHWQGRGLGRLMMSRLIAIARERGLREMVGWVLADNAGMLGMMSKLGFAAASDAEDRRLKRVTLALRPAASPGA